MKRSKDDSDAVQTLQLNSSNETIGGASTVVSGVRTTGRVKKPKTVFDPSDNYIPRAQQRASTQHLAASGNTPATTTANSINSNSSSSSSTESNTSGGAITAGSTLKIQSQQAATNNAEIGSSGATSVATVNSSGYSGGESIDYGKGFDTCTKCTKTEPKRGSGFKSRFIACKQCAKKWHITCLNVDLENLSQVRKKYKCVSCRTCHICNSFNDMLTAGGNSELLTCCVCVQSYHIECHYPAIVRSKVNERIWKCHKCETATPSVKREANPKATASEANVKMLPVAGASRSGTIESFAETIGSATSEENVSSNNTNRNDNGQTYKERRRHSSHEHIKTKDEQEDRGSDNNNNDDEDGGSGIGDADGDEKMRNGDDNHDDNVDDEKKKRNDGDDNDNDDEPLKVKDWSVEHVVKFFSKHYPSEAKAFKEHDIDGESLLLLRRRDLIQRFNLKLGPSLRVFELVATLQNKKDTLINAWND